jgi:sulfur carrier protein
MNVILNGETTEVRAGATVQALLDGLDLPAGGRGVAVAVDAEVVPRGEWERHELNDGAKVEILRAIQGG